MRRGLFYKNLFWQILLHGAWYVSNFSFAIRNSSSKVWRHELWGYVIVCGTPTYRFVEYLCNLSIIYALADANGRVD